jgi:hypothetical protein
MWICLEKSRNKVTELAGHCEIGYLFIDFVPQRFECAGAKCCSVKLCSVRVVWTEGA